MDYSKYYTPPAVAELLINQLQIQSPISAIDICCGSCNLLYAAKKRWHNITLYGVDIIERSMPTVNCTKYDGRKYAIENAQKYPLVLANPPFDFVIKKREFNDLFSEIEAKNIKYETSRLENEMLLANLRLLTNKGTLLIIIPNTFVESEKNKSIRTYLAMNYFVQKVIRLPKETFGNARIGTYALIIKKNAPRKRTTFFINIQLVNGVNHITKTESLLQKNIQNGYWSFNEYHTYEINNYDIKRGSISSQLFSNSGIPVLHTAKSQNQWVPSVRFIPSNPKNEVYAETGDIVISRVGRSAGQWYVHEGERILISDCLYRLKDPNGIFADKLKKRKYGFPTKGVATQYITIKDFLGWYQTLE
jgi:type I restriction enzyme M protein